MAAGRLRTDRMLRTLSARQGMDWKSLDPAEKVRIIEAMGFTPIGGGSHQPDCPRSIGGMGMRCNCVPDGTSWYPPKDVEVARGETWEERLAASQRRSQQEEARWG